MNVESKKHNEPKLFKEIFENDSRGQLKNRLVECLSLILRRPQVKSDSV